MKDCRSGSPTNISDQLAIIGDAYQSESWVGCEVETKYIAELIHNFITTHDPIMLSDDEETNLFAIVRDLELTQSS
jgi:hypothetical protein